MDNDSDLKGILSLIRTHIEIRNRSWMKRIHRDCFIGSDMIDFLVTQGLADTRKEAIEIGKKMMSKKMIRHVTDSQKFTDSYHYYRFSEDDLESSILAKLNAGNGNGIYLGHGGCKWSFAPHTAHNSYVLDIALAEELERTVAGASVEARAHAIGKLRSRVREQAEVDAPDWVMTQTTTVNNTNISIYQRKRPRGEFNNVKMEGMIGESPRSFIQGVMKFERRKQWEGMFEDGVIVEAIDIGEAPNILLQDEDVNSANTPSKKMNGKNNEKERSKTPVKEVPSKSVDFQINTPALPPKALQTKSVVIARTTDDVISFLQTVDLAGVPSGMAIGFLNDPERQHALAHLRKQMMLSNPQECMLCETHFENAVEIRFCPCCAMVSCASCVSKRVFEVVSRQVVSVCVHCFRESSRIRHPPQAVQDTTGIDESIRGKWWRPEELGILDYSQTMSTVIRNSSVVTASTTALSSPMGGSMKKSSNQSTVTNDLYNDDDQLVMDRKLIVPLIPGLLDEVMSPDTNDNLLNRLQENEKARYGEAPTPDGGSLGIHIPPDEANNDVSNASVSSPLSPAQITSNNYYNQTIDGSQKTARCKSCGAIISRSMEAIESHIEECSALTAAPSGRSSIVNGNGNSAQLDQKSYTVNGADGSITVSHGNSKIFAGIQRRPEMQQCGTRIIYRTANPQSAYRPPREVCAFQDCFVDSDGSCFLYEISVRHCEVRGIPGYVTADVMLLLHVARPIKGTKGQMSNISIISQVDTRSKGQWLLSFLTDEKTNQIAAVGKEDLVRELKQSGNLQNILQKHQENEDDPDAFISLEDFELMAVLGRGGFGKVMQVRYRPTNEVYAMKILKKSELRRRRQVERTQTERTILANVRHPFIVCLHFAFQNTQKLYMVMDFVQGGDFFTLMRKFKRIPEDWVRLYVIEVAMALQHLHDMDVVYRDLKPENILLCSDGYLKLTDFGLSRFFETRPPAPEDIVGDDDVITRSFCGTEQYMSPEMLLQQGHNYRMDWWCLGLLMHEMISARHPFQGPSHYDTLRNMVTKPPTIDSKLSNGAAAVVKSFLAKNPKARLCCHNGTSEMRNSPYFGCIDWTALYEKRIKMPYIPKLHDETDLSSFEMTFTREKAIDSIPDENSQTDSKKKSNKGSIFGLFGYGSGSNKANTNGEDDSFRGFSFTKEDEVSNGSIGNLQDAAGVNQSAASSGSLSTQSLPSTPSSVPPPPLSTPPISTSSES